ncbi:hypothetical protein E2C01_070240 [Portunus trituberculatus]|uniref:Uncharacterized protein n=1 Tax=Portunus trituberculatus TaxID=210409 RepID=A0A5B7I0T2_PORTR|nr:hypothetical protein [Portunus trituberculatus]
MHGVAGVWYVGGDSGGGGGSWEGGCDISLCHSLTHAHCLPLDFIIPLIEVCSHARRSTTL